MAKRISSGEPKPRRTPTRRRAVKTPEAPVQPAAEAVEPAAEPTPEARGAESPGSLAGEAATSGLMTSDRGQVPVAGSATGGTLASKVAHAASASGVWGREEAKPDRQAVARRAFELFLARGGVHGHDVEDWLAAERELRRR